MEIRLDPAGSSFIRSKRSHRYLDANLCLISNSVESNTGMPCNMQRLPKELSQRILKNTKIIGPGSHWPIGPGSHWPVGPWSHWPVGPGSHWPVGPGSQLARWARVPLAHWARVPIGPFGPGSQLAHWARSHLGPWFLIL